MSKITTILLIFLSGFVGCQTTPSAPLGNIFSPSTTIPPPETNSYTVNSASPPGTLNAAADPANPEGVSPFAPNKPYANLHEPSQEDVQPFQAATKSTVTETAGSVAKAPTRTGDEVMIPVSAYRTDTGLYSNDSRGSQSSGIATESVRLAPFQGGGQ